MSPVLNKQCGMYLAMPDGEARLRPVVYLLHGLSDNYTGWQRHTSIERYADACQLNVVMLEGDRSYYLDALDGSGAYEQHILAAVRFVDQTFHVLSNPESRGIGGLSMGGYGALKIALKYPHLFHSTSPLSGVLDIAKWDESVDRKKILQRVAGGAPGPSDDCFALSQQGTEHKIVMPKLYISCGLDDELIDHNRRFHSHLDRLKIDHEYVENPGGHNWEYWDQNIGAALAFHAKALHPKQA